MRKRVKQPKRRSGDVNEIARKLVDLSTSRSDNEQPPTIPVPKSVSQYMAEIGRRGGQIGGKQRLQTLSAEERHRIAQKAAKTRWAGHDELVKKG